MIVGKRASFSCHTDKTSRCSRVHKFSPRLKAFERAAKLAPTPADDVLQDTPVPTPAPAQASGTIGRIAAPRERSRGYLPPGRQGRPADLPPQQHDYLTLLSEATTATALQRLYARHRAAQPAAFHAVRTLRRLVAICTPEQGRHPQPATGVAVRLAHQLLADLEQVCSTISFLEAAEVLRAALLLRVTPSQPQVQQLAEQALKRLQQRPAAADMRNSHRVISRLARARFRPPAVWLHSWCRATEQEVAVMSVASIRLTVVALAVMHAAPPTPFMHAMLRALQSAGGDAATDATTANRVLWAAIRRMCCRPLKQWRLQFPIVATIWGLDRESPEETDVLDAIHAASTWQQVRGAVRAAPPGALTVRAARAAVLETCRRRRQQDCAAVAATPATSQQGNHCALAGGTEASDGGGGTVEARTSEEQQWVGELAALWSEERVGGLGGVQAAEVLTSMMEARMDVPADVVHRLLHLYFKRSAGVPSRVGMQLVCATCEAGVQLPEVAVAGLLRQVEAGFQQLDTLQLLQLARSLHKLPAQQVPGSLLDALVARCLHVPLDSLPDDAQHSPPLALVEAVRQLSPEASAKLAQLVPPIGQTARTQAAPDKAVERRAVARVISASSWWEVQQGIGSYDDGSYSQLPQPLLLAAYTALGRCLDPQCTDSDAGDAGGAAGGGDREGLEKVHDAAAGGEREPQLAAMLAALAQRCQALQPALDKAKGDLLGQLLWALGSIPATYRKELVAIAGHTVEVLVTKLALQHANASAAVGSALRAMVRLRLDLPDVTRQRLREQALGAAGDGKTVLMYWAMRAMNEGCVGAADRAAVEAVLQGLGEHPPGSQVSVVQELRKVRLSTKQWLRQYPVAQTIWGAGATKAWQEARQPGTMVAHARTWKAVGKIMEDSIQRGQPWDGPHCCAAMERLEELGQAGGVKVGDSDPGARDLALRVLHQLSRSIEGCRPLQLAAALGSAGRLGLQPAEGVLEALLGAIASRVSYWRTAVEVLECLDRMRYYPGTERMASLLAVLQPSLHTMPTPFIIAALRSCCVLRHRPTPPFLTAALKQVQAKAAGLSPLSLSDLLVALALLEHQPEASVRQTLLLRLDHACWGMTAKQRNRSIWALLRLKWRWPPAWARRASRKEAEGPAGGRVG